MLVHGATSINVVRQYHFRSLNETTHNGNTPPSPTHDASRAIESLAETVSQSAEQVESLGQRSEEISRVTGVIKEIADQTNLLALNAAIEAARAGETDEHRADEEASAFTEAASFERKLSDVEQVFQNWYEATFSPQNVEIAQSSVFSVIGERIQSLKHSLSIDCRADVQKMSKLLPTQE